MTFLEKEKEGKPLSITTSRRGSVLLKAENTTETRLSRAFRATGRALTRGSRHLSSSWLGVALTLGAAGAVWHWTGIGLAGLVAAGGSLFFGPRAEARGENACAFACILGVTVGIVVAGAAFLATPLFSKECMTVVQEAARQAVLSGKPEAHVVKKFPNYMTGGTLTGESHAEVICRSEKNGVTFLDVDGKPEGYFYVVGEDTLSTRPPEPKRRVELKLLDYNLKTCQLRSGR